MKMAGRAGSSRFWPGSPCRPAYMSAQGFSTTLITNLIMVFQSEGEIAELMIGETGDDDVFEEI